MALCSCLLSDAWDAVATRRLTSGVAPVFAGNASDASTAVACTRTVLNCSAAAQQRQLAAHGRPLAIPLDPTNPIESQFVSCASASAVVGDQQQEAVVVFSGARCPLWRPTATGCFWNATAASFQGGSCVAAPALDCVCSGTGLADFRALPAAESGAAAATAVTISRLTPVPPRTAWASTWAVAAVVIAISAALPASTGVLRALERRARTRALRELTRALGAASCGFRQLTTGDWLHAVPAPNVTAFGGTVSGELVNIAAACSLPLIRLRLAIPEEILAPGDLLRVAGFTCPATAKNVASGSLFSMPRRAPSGSRSRKVPRSRIEMVIGAVQVMEQQDRVRQQRKEARAAAEKRRRAEAAQRRANNLPRRDSSGSTLLESHAVAPDRDTSLFSHPSDASASGRAGAQSLFKSKKAASVPPISELLGLSTVPDGSLLSPPPDVEEDLLLVTAAAGGRAATPTGGGDHGSGGRFAPREDMMTSGAWREDSLGDDEDDSDDGEAEEQEANALGLTAQNTALLCGEAELTDSQWMAGTALATAALYRGQLLPASELALRQMRLAQVFSLVTTCVNSFVPCACTELALVCVVIFCFMDHAMTLCHPPCCLAGPSAATTLITWSHFSAPPSTALCTAPAGSTPRASCASLSSPTRSGPSRPPRASRWLCRRWMARRRSPLSRGRGGAGWCRRGFPLAGRRRWRTWESTNHVAVRRARSQGALLPLP